MTAAEGRETEGNREDWIRALREDLRQLTGMVNQIEAMGIDESVWRPVTRCQNCRLAMMTRLLVGGNRWFQFRKAVSSEVAEIWFEDDCRGCGRQCLSWILRYGYR